MSPANVPALTGRTLVVVDRGDLMAGPADGPLTRADAASVAGAALACRAAHARVVVLGAGEVSVRVRPGWPF
ncbi:hypothetical protein [Nonomuraea aridisoli]|uniref:Uncharacterized protein n=1 Tax=Nonomuraea aridisoli TaxID=2070368 RepID=A0A2W2EY07_9ACTN|nr:hypothetical protein [Nonomuraea aridisoli]PZG18450.1 hypothetical protein C1J01_15015 [Nonomuraea aridisoli]